MKQWLAIFAAVAFLALPAMVSADDETRIPPEANWTSTPPAPAILAVPQKRLVSTAQEQASDITRPVAMQLSDADAQYQAVNDAAIED